MPVLLLGAFAADATIIQVASASFDLDQTVLGDEEVVQDQSTSPPDPAPETVFAAVSDEGYVAAAAADTFGNVGMQGRQFRGGVLETFVIITSDEAVNPFSVPQHAVANFIIDGGVMALLGRGPNPGDASILDFLLTTHFAVVDAGGSVIREIEWSTGALLESVNFQLPILTLTGTEDIGINLPAGSFEAEIPLAFVSVDLGQIPAGGHIEIGYEAFFHSNVAVTEVVYWEFSDPLNISGTGHFPTIVFGQAQTVVPEPATAVLLGLGAGIPLVRGLRRRRGK